MASAGDLSDEVLLCIFRQLSVKDLAPLQLVNHRWRRVACDRSLYSVITINDDDSTPVIVALLKQQKHSIRHLHIIERGDIYTLAPFISECCNLETLSLKLCNGDGDDIQKMIERSRCLATVIFQHSPCIRRVGMLFEALSTSSVKKIVIRNLIDDIETEHLSELRGIEDLRLKSIVVHLDGIYRFCSNNTHCLTTLKLNPSNPSYLDSASDLNETLFKAIGSCERLKTLCLGAQIASKMNDVGFAYITRLNSLSTFEINNAFGVSASAFEEFFARSSAGRLRKISLFQCPSVNNTVLRRVANRCHNLEKFTLEKSKETRSVKDSEDLVAFAKCCRKLRRLHLYGAHIAVAEVLHLLPQYLPELRSLSYSNKEEPMKIPSFLSVLEERMPQFEVCGLQWTFNLFVKCTKKTHSELNSLSNLVCSTSLKTLAHCY